jgi:hypothetical protein
MCSRQFVGLVPEAAKDLNEFFERNLKDAMQQ